MCALFITASGFDGQSLLQQDIGQTAKTGLQSSVSTLMEMLTTDILPEAPLLRGLLKTVQEGKAPSAEVDAIFGSVLDLIEQLLLHLKNATSTDTGVLASVLTDLQHCIETTDLVHENATQEAGHAYDSHKECRTEEKDAFQTKEDDCLLVTQRFTLAQNPNGHCRYPEQDPPIATTEIKSKIFKNWLIDASVFWENNHHLLTEHSNWTTCHSSMTELKAKEEECDTKQASYEGAVCSLKEERDLACSSYSSCYTGATAAHQADLNVISPMDIVRQSQVKMLKRIRCIVTNLRNGNYDIQSMGCTGDYADEMGDFIVQYPTVPGPQTCDLIVPVPGDANFQNLTYTFETLPDALQHTEACVVVV